MTARQDPTGEGAACYVAPLGRFKNSHAMSVYIEQVLRRVRLAEREYVSIRIQPGHYLLTDGTRTVTIIKHRSGPAGSSEPPSWVATSDQDPSQFSDPMPSWRLAKRAAERIIDRQRMLDEPQCSYCGLRVERHVRSGDLYWLQVDRTDERPSHCSRAPEGFHLPLLPDW